MSAPAPHRRSNPWTVAALGVIAAAASDLVHEVGGHGVAVAFTPGVRALSLSTVALQTSAMSRGVAAAGSIANVVVAVLALAALRGRRLGPAALLLWLVAAFDLLNGTGYLLYSGALDFGDWEVVIRGLAPHAAWRIALVVAGAAAYAGSIAWLARTPRAWVRAGELSRDEAASLVVPAYLAGGALLVAGSLLNPVGWKLVLLSGLAAGFAAPAGLLMVPRLLPAAPPSAPAGRLPLSLGWIAAAAIVAIAFVALLGPGIALGR